MRIHPYSVFGLALAACQMANAQPEPYYNPTNPDSPTGYTIGYQLYRTIGCPGRALLDRPCNAPPPVAEAAPAPVVEAAPAPAIEVTRVVRAAPEPAPVAAAVPAPVQAPAPVLNRTLPLVLKDVNFKFNSAELNPLAYPILNQAAEELMSDSYPHVQVDGYTDAIGPAAYNMTLSERRAQSVRQYLIARGVPEDRLATEGFGKTHFIATNKTRVGRYENRRVELHVTG